MRAVRFGVVLTAIVMVAGVFGGIADATFPGTNGKIAFTNAANNLFNINPDGTSRNQLTFAGEADCAGFFSDPSYAPNGQSIAFSSLTGIRVVPAAGGSATALVGTVAGDCFPAWNPAGTELIFARTGPGFAGTGVLNRIPAGGGSPTAIFGSTAGDARPDWAPGGGVVAFDRTVGGTTQINTIPAGGGAVTQLTACPAGAFCGFASHSPSGTQIALRVGAGNPATGISVISAAAASQVPAPLPNSLAGDTNPSYSPDGTRIAGHDLGGAGLFHLAASGLPGRTVVSAVAGDDDANWGVAQQIVGSPSPGTSPSPTVAPGNGTLRGTTFKVKSSGATKRLKKVIVCATAASGGATTCQTVIRKPKAQRGDYSFTLAAGTYNVTASVRRRTCHAGSATGPTTASAVVATGGTTVVDWFCTKP